MLKKFIEHVEIDDLEAQQLGVIRQFLALELITCILVTAVSLIVFGAIVHFEVILVLLIPAQLPLALIVLIYQKLIKPRLYKKSVPEAVSSYKIRRNHNLNVLTKIFVVIFKWIISYIAVWIVLTFFWAKYCFAITSSEAGQAMGLVMGFFIITPGIFIIFAAIHVSISLKKNQHKGWTLRNIVAGGLILMVVLSCSWGIFYLYRNYQAHKQADKLWEQSQMDAIKKVKMDEAQ